MKMRRIRWWSAAAAALLVAALTGCFNPMEAGSGSDARSPSEIEPWSEEELASIERSMTSVTRCAVGKPERRHHQRPWRVDGEDVAHVWLNIATVEAHGRKTGWHSLVPPQSQYDLLELAADTAPVGLNDLPPDTYSHFRLILAEGSSLELKSGEQLPLYVPSGKQTGIKIIGRFDVQEGYVVHVVLDFNPERSVKLVYRGKKHSERRYALLPLVRIDEVVKEPVDNNNTSQMPVASFPTWDYTVGGAEPTAVDGNYTQKETYSDPPRPKYERAGGGGYLYAFEGLEDGFQHWAIHDALLPDGSSLFDPLYRHDDTTASKPRYDGWNVVTGTGPAPTVLRMPISGDTTDTGFVLTGHYLFSDPDGDSEGATTFQWVRFTNSTDITGGTLIGGASLSYTTTAADDGSYLRIEVTPVDANGLAGTPALSGAVGVKTGD